ncbi:MAG: isopentenyl phosphate kinase [archaeon GB-1867-005]|nr:isopentenyl phosphate kinase [Candidatus Culexmicrobium cathedralense]
MKSKPLVVVKFGGSVITIKDSPKRANLDVIRRLAVEVSDVIDFFNLIVVHGGGSFGHPIASKYNLHLGFKDNGQLKGLAETRMAMEELNRLVVEELVGAGVPAVSVQPSACIIANSGEIAAFHVEPIELMLQLNLTPVLYGDVVFDEKLGFTIISGDKIASHLAIRFNARRLVFACDVDGVYTSDPKKNLDAKLIPSVAVDDVGRLIKGMRGCSFKGIDVTGGIAGKLMEAVKPARAGIDVLIVNALKPLNVKRAILGEELICTRIVG